MKLIKVADYNEMSRIAADYVIDKLQQNPQIKLGWRQATRQKDCIGN